MKKEKWISVDCPWCGEKFRAELLIGEHEHELKDGYHGECPSGHCGFRYFEAVVIK